MQFSEYETVTLLKDYPDENLKKGTIGVIVMVYEEPNEAYEVEFTDKNGHTKALLTLLPSEIIKCD